MSGGLDPLGVVRRRLAQQRLAAAPLPGPAEVVRWLGAVQAQEHAEAKWSLAERTTGCTDADVQAALDRGEVLRTHVLRPTWHYVARADLRWLLRLSAPRVHQVNGTMYRQEGLDPALRDRGTAVVAAAVADEGPRTRTELQARLRTEGLDLERFRLGYLLMHAELEAVVCSGPMRGKQQTYALVDDRVPGAPGDERPREDAVSELVRRYLVSHGPGTLRDLRAWSGLTLTDLRTGVEAAGAALVRETGPDGGEWWGPADPVPVPASTGAQLVPMYDETVVAYQDLRVVMAAEPAMAPLVERAAVVEGRTVGTWRRTLAAREVVVELRPLGPLDPADRAALERAVERFGRFLALPARLEVSDPVRGGAR